MHDFSVFNLQIVYFFFKFLFLDPNNPQTVSALNKTGQWSYVCEKVIFDHRRQCRKLCVLKINSTMIPRLQCACLSPPPNWVVFLEAVFCVIFKTGFGPPPPPHVLQQRGVLNRKDFWIIFQVTVTYSKHFLQNRAKAVLLHNCGSRNATSKNVVAFPFTRNSILFRT